MRNDSALGRWIKLKIFVQMCRKECGGVRFFFFFSSRRRHTRFDCDWSSDVCSSDLDAKQLSYAYVIPGGAARVAVPIDQPTAEVDLLVEDTVATVTAARLDTLGVQEIGRASCRERV